MPTDDVVLQVLADRAVALVPDGAVVGLGTGRAATAFIHALAAGSLAVRGVPTSRESEAVATQLGLWLASLEDVEAIDIAVDGADEVDPSGNMIKGYGGALVREKVVATAAKRLVILVGPEKLVPALGSRGRLPVEVVPFAAAFVARALAKMGLPSRIREHEGRAFASDNGNVILDCDVKPISDPAALDAGIRAVPGVVGTGLFVGFAPTVLTP